MFIGTPQKGVTLVEVLVAVVVLSIGLLGLAQLQMTTLRQTQSALLRSHATLLGYDLTDRMRANTAGVIAGYYNQSLVGDHQGDHDCSVVDASGTETNANPADCSPQELAENDLLEWAKTVARELPSGQGIVCLDSTPKDDPPATPGAPKCDNLGTVYVVKVWWTDGYDAQSGQPVTQLFVTPFVP